MGFLDLLFGAKVSNPALLSVMETLSTNPSDEHTVDLWQKLLKTKVLLATTAEGKDSFKKVKQAREAQAVPFTVVHTGNGESDLAVFTDNASLEAFAPGSPFVVVTGEDAFAIASGKNYNGLVLNPGSQTKTNLRSWQHAIFIEKVGEATKLHTMASKLVRAGNHGDAEGVLKAAIACAQRDPGPQHPLTAELNLELARAMRAQGKLNEAEWVYRRSLQIYELAGSCDAEVASVSEALGSLYIENQKAAQATPLLVRALEVYESLPGSKPDNLSRILCQLAELRREESASDAEQYYKRATVLLEERKNPEALGVMIKLAALMQADGRPKDAAAQYQRLLTLPQTIKRCRDFDLAVAHHHLGQIKIEEGAAAEATEHLEKALEIYKRDGGTAADISAVETLIEEAKAKQSAPEEKSPDKPGEKTLSGQSKAPSGRFGAAAGKKLGDLPFLDMSQVKNNPKATVSGAHSVSKGPEKNLNPEEEALQKMKAFLDGVGDGEKPAQQDSSQSKSDAIKDEVRSEAVEAIISAVSEVAESDPPQTTIDEPALEMRKESLKTEARPGAPTLIDEPSLRPDELKPIPQPPPKPEPPRPAKLEAPKVEAPKVEAPEAEATKSDTTTKNQTPTEIGNADHKIFEKPVDGEISMVFNSSVIGKLNKDDRFDTPIGARVKEESAKAINPETDAVQTVAAAPVEEKKEEKKGLFDAKIDGEISMFFNKSQLKDVTKDERFDKPIAQRLKEESKEESKLEPKEEAKPEPKEEAKPEPKEESAQPERNGLFDEKLDDSLGDAFSNLLTAPEAAKPDSRFDTPVAEGLDGAVKEEKAKVDSKSDNGLFDEKLDDSLGDAFSSLLSNPAAIKSDSRFDTPIGERAKKEEPAPERHPLADYQPEPIPEGSQQASLDELKAAIRAEKAKEAAAKAAKAEAEAEAARVEAARVESAKLFDDNLEDSLGSAFASLLADPSKADDRFETAIAARAAEPKKTPEELLREGTLLVQQQKLDEAIKLFDKVTQMAPNDIKAWYCKGSTLHLKSQFEDALYCFNHVLNLDKDNQKAMLRKAECLSKLTRPDQAIAVYDRLLLLQPKFIPGWLSKARALLQQRKLKEALDCYQMVLALDSTNEEANKAKNLISAKLAAAK